jgi:hypothetical protein
VWRGAAQQAAVRAAACIAASWESKSVSLCCFIPRRSPKSGGGVSVAVCGCTAVATLITQKRSYCWCACFFVSHQLHFVMAGRELECTSHTCVHHCWQVRGLMAQVCGLFAAHFGQSTGVSS